MTSTEGLRRTPHAALRTVVLAVAALAVAAIVTAAWFAVSWYRAAHDDALALGLTRDAALQDAQLVAVNLNTMDYEHVQGALDLREQSATGAALAEFRTNRDAYLRTVTESKTTSTARVRDAALADLDAAAGTAMALVGVDVTYQREHGDASCVRQRLQLDMRRTPAGWKVNQLAPIGALDPMPGPCPVAVPRDPPN